MVKLSCTLVETSLHDSSVLLVSFAGRADEEYCVLAPYKLTGHNRGGAIGVDGSPDLEEVHCRFQTIEHEDVASQEVEVDDIAMISCTPLAKQNPWIFVSRDLEYIAQDGSWSCRSVNSRS